MRTHRNLVAALAALILALPSTGCYLMGMGPGTPSMELSSAQFDDIPVPRGFALIDSEGRSFSYSEGGNGPSPVRLGRLEYSGLGDADEILQWYAAEMPRAIHGWSSGSAVEGRPSILFTKGGERCLVTAKPEGSALRITVERNTGGAAPE